MESERVCRTCLQIFGVKSVSHLNHTEEDSDHISLGQKLQACVPELTVDIVHDPVICETCCAAVILAYQFKSSCLENEKTLYKFIKQRKQNSYDLLTTSDLLKIVRKDINEEHSYSFVEKCYSNGHVTDSDSDSDGEAALPKLSKTVKSSLEDLVKQALADSSLRNIVNKEDKRKVTAKAKEKNKHGKRSVKNKNEPSPSTLQNGDTLETTKSPSSTANLRENHGELKEKTSSHTPSSSKIIADPNISANTKHSRTRANVKTTPKSTLSSVNNDKQTKETRKNATSLSENEDLEDSISAEPSVENIEELQVKGIPVDPKTSESGCKTPRSADRQRKQNMPKKNSSKALDSRDNPSANVKASTASVKSIESKENATADKEKDNKRSVTKKHSLANDEASVKRIETNKDAADNKEGRKRSTSKNRQLVDDKASPQTNEDAADNKEDRKRSTSKNRQLVNDEASPQTNEDAAANKEKGRKRSTSKNRLLVNDDASLETNKDAADNKEKDNKRSTTKKRSLDNDEATTRPQRKITKKKFYSDMETASDKVPKQISTTSEKKNVCKNEIPPSPKIKMSHSDYDISIPGEDTIENDILQINEMILKNDLSESSKTSSYYRKENRRYCCTKCNKAYNFKSHFDVHLKSHIFKKLYTCPICEKDFTQEKYLKSHAMLHTTTNTGLHQCGICLKYLSASTALKRHYRTHTGERPFSCTCCNKHFSQKIQLAVHMRTHTGYRPFTCNICRAGFTQKSHLMGHIRIHTGEKPYKCDQCPKCFRKSYALQIHKHSHSVKPFQCKACNFLFKDPDTFERHVNKHLLQITNTGSHVLKKTKSRRRLLDELEQDVKDINIAVTLREQIEGDALEIKPKESKPYLYRCDICSRGFSTRFSMKRHIKVHMKGDTQPFLP